MTNSVACNKLLMTTFARTTSLVVFSDFSSLRPKPNKERHIPTIFESRGVLEDAVVAYFKAIYRYFTSIWAKNHTLNTRRARTQPGFSPAQVKTFYPSTRYLRGANKLRVTRYQALTAVLCPSWRHVIADGFADSSKTVTVSIHTAKWPHNYRWKFLYWRSV
jgi:hypothetical protein